MTRRSTPTSPALHVRQLLIFTCGAAVAGAAGFQPADRNELTTAVREWCVSDNKTAATATYGGIAEWDVSKVTSMYRLFYGQGIRAVGVDTVAAEIGISKRTLYNHFASKDELIVAYLTRRLRLWDHYARSLRRWHRQSAAEAASTAFQDLRHRGGPEGRGTRCGAAP